MMVCFANTLLVLSVGWEKIAWLGALVNAFSAVWSFRDENAFYCLKNG